MAGERGMSRAARIAFGVLLLLLAAGAGAAWWLLRGAEEEAVAATVSPEAAAQAEAKLERLREEGETIRLSEVEFTSLLRYGMRDRIPGDLYAPAVEFRGDTLRLMGRIPSDRLPRLPELGPVADFLPDTADVDVLGHLRMLEPGRAALDVRRVTFAGIPVPERLYPRALERMGRPDEPGLPAAAFPFHLPEGVGAARVEGGTLILSP